MKYWEIVADKLSAAGWSWGYCSAAVTREGWRWIVDAHREGCRWPSLLTVPCAREGGTPSLNLNVLFIALMRGVPRLRQEILKLCGLSAVWTRVAFVDNLNYLKLC